MFLNSGVDKYFGLHYRLDLLGLTFGIFLFIWIVGAITFSNFLGKRKVFSFIYTLMIIALWVLTLYWFW